MTCETLVLILGDQLSLRSAALDHVTSDSDEVLLMEVREEADYVPQHKIRLVLFFAAMRHFRDALRERGYQVEYTQLDDPGNRGSIAGELERRLRSLKPKRLVCVQPGDHRVLQMIVKASRSTGTRLEVLEDTHFMSSITAFQTFTEERKSLLMEYFYRDMRRKTGLLMRGREPVGGQWNFDQDNRESFGKSGPPEISMPQPFPADDVTREVIAMVEKQFPDAPGRLEHFDYPVSYQQADAALEDFIEHRLHGFGRYQDAMALNRPYLYHSRLSSALNMHLLDPRDAVQAAVQAFEDGAAELNSVEGFVRQIIGWREYVRGVYWTRMPDYADANELAADLDMPEFMWSGETDMACIRASVSQLIDHAYAHHIQRLMVLGLFSLLLGVRPYDVHRWHMSMYVDAIDWVSLPNVVGMSQYGDGGVVGTKPYAASGNYISRMSDYCANCRYNPKKATGDDACPITTLYWDFLSRNRDKLGANRRMGFQFKNLDRKDDGERHEIRRAATKLKSEFTRTTYL